MNKFPPFLYNIILGNTSSIPESTAFAMDPHGFNLALDWWKYLILLFGILLALLLLLRLTTVLFRMLLPLFCIGAGVLTALLFAGPAQAHLQERLPADFIPYTQHISWILCFIFGYLILAVIIQILRIPFAKSAKSTSETKK